ncbi:ribosomal protein L4 domain-containing protein [Cytidiella melzeri]|nr:ribosomal protein L4 domain-containing protein [Cytidiella melzeri]
MLAAVRRTLLRSPQCARLSTIASSEASTTDSLLSLYNTDTRQQSGATFGDVDGATGVKALPIARPLLLALSSLVRPGPGAGSPDNQLVELDPSVFSHPIRRDILHLCVVQHLDCLRQGSASTKNRGEVRGSGRKIRPQKGTGKARLGDGQSPMLRGGGVAFGPKPRDFSTKLPRKVIQMGMRVALSAKIREQSLGVVESLDWPEIKTKPLVERLRELGWEKTLFVTGREEVPVGLEKSASNILGVDTVTAEELTVYDAVKWHRLVLDVSAVQWFEHTLGRAARVE